MAETAVKERPVLMHARSVRGILEGRKRQTRRPLKPQPPESYVNPVCREGWWMWHEWHPERRGTEYSQAPLVGDRRCPYGRAGDRLWVRETWGWDWYDDGNSRAWKRPVYRADPGAQPRDNGTPTRWRPSIHMPRRASRILLELTEVRVERVQEISEADAIAEGVDPDNATIAAGVEKHLVRGSIVIDRFARHWDETNAHRLEEFGWEANPFVWVLGFDVVEVADG
jgi:hypothetical protein